MRQRLVLFASACPWISNLATDERALVGLLEDAKQSAISGCQRRYPGHPAPSDLPELAGLVVDGLVVPTHAHVPRGALRLGHDGIPRFQSNALSSIRHYLSELDCVVQPIRIWPYEKCAFCFALNNGHALRASLTVARCRM